MKKADEPAHNKRQKLARELADRQAKSRATSQDQAQNTDAALALGGGQRGDQFGA